MKLEKKYVMSNSDFNFVGVDLGYEWNTVCDEVRKCEAYGMDGSGFFTIYRGETEFNSPILTDILNKIYVDNPDADEIIVLDNF